MAAEAPVQPRLGAVGWLRWMWRQLTSMRTALFLLLLLAVAALPGSTFPQRSIDSARTEQWIADHPSAGPVLDALGFFNVYSAPWFAAVYLLLLLSLVGCVVPRTRQHWQALRSRPPRAPRRLERLPASGTATVDGTAADVLAATREALRGRRYRVHAHDEESVSAEKGYLKETGNLVFHLALVGIILGVAAGHVWGWKGDVIVPVGQTFANTVSRYDTFLPGPWVDVGDLKPFTLTLDRFDARFETRVQGAGQLGMPRDFTAHVAYTPQPGAAPEKREVKVNGPLETGGGTVFLLGNGYAPHVTVRDTMGKVLLSDAVPFLSQDTNYNSVGAIKVPAAAPRQLGFAGLFLPTAKRTEAGFRSVFPDLLDPQLLLTVYEGELFPKGRPQSVYSLETAGMRQLVDARGEPVRMILMPGQTFRLPDGRGSITFDGVQRFAGLSIREDPGKTVTLGCALLALAGLVASLVVRRRRIFVRVAPAAGKGRTVVTLGGLTKDDDEDTTMVEEIEAVLDRIKEHRR